MDGRPGCVWPFIPCFQALWDLKRSLCMKHFANWQYLPARLCWMITAFPLSSERFCSRLSRGQDRNVPFEVQQASCGSLGPRDTVVHLAPAARRDANWHGGHARSWSMAGTTALPHRTLALRHGAIQHLKSPHDLFPAVA